MPAVKKNTNWADVESQTTFTLWLRETYRYTHSVYIFIYVYIYYYDAYQIHKFVSCESCVRTWPHSSRGAIVNSVIPPSFRPAKTTKWANLSAAKKTVQKKKCPLRTGHWALFSPPHTHTHTHEKKRRSTRILHPERLAPLKIGLRGYVLYCCNTRSLHNFPKIATRMVKKNYIRYFHDLSNHRMDALFRRKNWKRTNRWSQIQLSTLDLVLTLLAR